ncbi:hypothetical protein PSPO01_08536 [Paraphaeosphaeria sporulosa]
MHQEETDCPLRAYLLSSFFTPSFSSPPSICSPIMHPRKSLVLLAFAILRRHTFSFSLASSSRDVAFGAHFSPTAATRSSKSAFGRWSTRDSDSCSARSDIEGGRGLGWAEEAFAGFKLGLMEGRGAREVLLEGAVVVEGVDLSGDMVERG